MKREPLQVVITSDGDRIGSLTPDEFRSAIGHFTRSKFLSGQVAEFNRHKHGLGEPERAEVQLRNPDPK